MIGRIALRFSLLTLLAIPVCAVWAADPPSNAQTELVVLRNGEVLSGVVSRQGDRYVIRGDGTEIRLASRDVDFLCQTLDEAYNVQRNRVVAGRIEDHLNLADWCMRQKLLGYAAREITAAMEIDSKNPRLVALDNRLQRELQPDVPQDTAADSTGKLQPVSAEELERLVRSLPPSTVETFTATIQPMLLNYCATAGCHGPSSSSSFTLLRSSEERIATRRLTERNLYNTLEWIDHDNPIDSKLLSAAREPHGPHQASGATGVGTTKYQELMNWVLQASPNSNARLQASAPASMSAAMLPFGAPPVLASPAPATVLMPSNAFPGANLPLTTPSQAAAQRAAVAKIRRAPNTGTGAASTNAKTATANLTPSAANPTVEDQPSPAAADPH
ncbi:MAG TPA: hypothetical protein VMJ32_02170 [Pirellulales bacterium]|nr:hypothetical protein [Pirellulales bacterium]